MDPISSIRINFGLVIPFKNALICGEYWRSILFIWRRQFGILFDVLTVFSSRKILTVCQKPRIFHRISFVILFPKEYLKEDILCDFLLMLSCRQSNKIEKESGNAKIADTCFCFVCRSRKIKSYDYEF